MSFFTSLMVGLGCFIVFGQTAVTVGCTYWIVQTIKGGKEV